MQNTLREALQACATFNVTGDANDAVTLAFLPGIYSTMTQATAAVGGSSKTVVAFTDPSNLNNAGYTCDEVADDYIAGNTDQKVHITGANRVRYRDFLDTVQRVGVNVTKIVIQNKTNPADQSIFDQEIQVARTAIGAKGGMDFIQLQNYVSVNAYDRSKITIDLTQEPLYLTPEVFMAMVIPAGANFSIQFFFEAPALS